MIMKQATLIRLEQILNKVEKGNEFVIIAIISIIICPFIAIYEACKYVVRKIRGMVQGMVYDADRDKWITKKEKAKERLKEKQTNREIPLKIENHVMPKKNGRFYFFEKRKIIIPYDKLVYVETTYNEKMHRFFEENAEWLDTWQKWHGWDIVSYSYEDIKEGMLYPEDFVVFKHGFLWHSPRSSWDKESDIYGNIHYYFEIDPDSTTSIKEQMELFIRQIYDAIDWA